MFKLRQWISLVAAVGVLVHAGLVVSHNAAALERAALTAAFNVICHADSELAGQTQQPAIQDPFEKQSRCPICLGFASAAAVLPAMPPWHIERRTVRSDIVVVAQAVQPPLQSIRPFGQGPPRVA